MSESQANHETESDRDVARDLALRELCAHARPPEPTEAEWDGVWSNVVTALDAPAVIPMPERRRMSWRVLAQAAALLLMATLVVARYRPSVAPEPAVPVAENPDTPARRSPTATLATVDIPEGELMVIHIGVDGLSTTELPSDERSNALDESLAFLNRMEAIGE